MNIAISSASTVISLVFTPIVFKQYFERRRLYHLIWGIALSLWVIAVASELVATIQGWSPLTYRTYYASGALLIPAWLGLGTLFLLAPRRFAIVTAAILIIASLAGIWLIFTWPIPRPADLQQAEEFIPVKIFPFIPVRLLLVVLNSLGTIAFVGGALHSALVFRRNHLMKERAIGTMLIAAGGLVAAGAHSLGALGGLELFRPSELLAVVLIFLGFLQTSAHRPSEARLATRALST